MGWFGDEFEEVGATFLEGLEIADFVIREAIFPAAEHDAGPFEGQGPDDGGVATALFDHVVVVSLGPEGVTDGFLGIFVEALA